MEIKAAFEIGAVLAALVNIPPVAQTAAASRMARIVYIT
jgi:hypothetical protein